MKPTLTLLVCAILPSLAWTQEGDKDAPLSMRVLLKRKEYTLEPASKSSRGRILASPVCLVVEVTNRGKHKLEVEGPPEPRLTLIGPGKETLKATEIDRFFVSVRRTWELDPGESMRIWMPQLAFHDAIIRKGIHVASAGEYVLKLDFPLTYRVLGEGPPPMPGGVPPKRTKIQLKVDSLELTFKEGDSAVYWTEALTDKDRDVQLSALHYFERDMKGKDKVLPDIGRLLSNSDTDVRAAASRAIGAAGKAGRGQLEGVLRLFKDEEPRVKAEAVRTLRAVAPEDAAARMAMAPLLLDANDMVRRAAAEEVRILLHANRKVEPELKAILIRAVQAEADLLSRVQLLRALVYVQDPEILRVVLPFVHSTSSGEWTSAIEAIGHICGSLPRDADRSLVREAVKELNSALKDPEKRAFAAHSLQYMTPEAKEAVPTLIWALDDPDSFPKSPNMIRTSICRTLGAIGPDAALAAPALVKRMFKDENWQVRAFAAEALARLGKTSHRHVPDLVAAMKDDMDQVRSAAAEALGHLGPFAGDGIPHLLHLLHTEPSEKTRISAAASLSRIGMKGRRGAVPFLIELLRDPSVQVAVSSASALGQIGRDAEDALPALRRMQKEPRFTGRSEIEEAIKSIESR